MKTIMHCAMWKTIVVENGIDIAEIWMERKDGIDAYAEKMPNAIRFIYKLHSNIIIKLTIHFEWVCYSSRQTAHRLSSLLLRWHFICCAVLRCAYNKIIIFLILSCYSAGSGSFIFCFFSFLFIIIQNWNCVLYA